MEEKNIIEDVYRKRKRLRGTLESGKTRTSFQFHMLAANKP